MNVNQIAFYLHWSLVVFLVVTSADIKSPTFSATTVYTLFNKILFCFPYNPI